MNWAFLNRIWRPDTFIVNGRDSYLHKMTVPNRFIRIAPNGRMSYSQRLTIKARYVYLLVCHVPFPSQGAGFLLQCTKYSRQASLVQMCCEPKFCTQRAAGEPSTK